MIDKQAILQELSRCTTEEQIQEFHATYLGKKGKLGDLYKELKDLSPEEKKEQGQVIQALVKEIEQSFFRTQEAIKRAQRDETLQKEIVDITTPGHHLTQ